VRVLLVWNGPANAEERTVMARSEVPFLRALHARGVAVTVVLFGDRGGVRDELQATGVDVHVLPPPLAPAARTLLRLVPAALRLRRVIASLRPDLIEATEPMVGLVAGVAVWLRRERLVYRRLHSGEGWRLVTGSRAAARLAPYTIVQCDAMRIDAVAKDRTPFDRVFVVPSGSPEFSAVDEGAIAAARRELGLDERARIIGVVSRLRFEKGIDVIVRAVAQLTDVDHLHVAIVGTGPEESSLRRLAARSPVPVHWVGHRDDVKPWLALFDVLAIPSRNEAFGRVALEAMAAACAIVASNVGGIPDTLGDSGRLVPPDDPSALANALRATLADPAEAARMRAAALARFQSLYTIERLVDARCAAWEQILQR
jgi:glycosyltransferase involved in cell wall biosynthesis